MKGDNQKNSETQINHLNHIAFDSVTLHSIIITLYSIALHFFKLYNLVYSSLFFIKNVNN